MSLHSQHTKLAHPIGESLMSTHTWVFTLDTKLFQSLLHFRVIAKANYYDLRAPNIYSFNNISLTHILLKCFQGSKCDHLVQDITVQFKLTGFQSIPQISILFILHAFVLRQSTKLRCSYIKRCHCFPLLTNQTWSIFKRKIKMQVIIAD